VALGNACEIVGFVVVLPAHLEILKAEVECFTLACDRVEPSHSSVLEGHLVPARVFGLTKLLHGCCDELLIFVVSAQDDTFLFGSDRFGRDRFLKYSVVGFRQSIEVRVGICSQLKGRLIAIFFCPFGYCRFIGREKLLEGGGVVVGMFVGVLELVDVANAGEILPVVGRVGLERPHAPEDSPIRFINLH
jgi:hypothetical protein